MPKRSNGRDHNKPLKMCSLGSFTYTSSQNIKDQNHFAAFCKLWIQNQWIQMLWVVIGSF